MSAVTLLPVLPPNWKVGVGNSSTNSNPVRQYRENVWISILQTFRTSTCCVKHRCQKSFPADYGYRGVRRSTVSQELSIHHLWCFLGPCKDRLSAWKMRAQGTLAPCRLSRETTLRGVTATGSLPKFWLNKDVVARSLTTCQVTVTVVELFVVWLRVRQQSTHKGRHKLGRLKNICLFYQSKWWKFFCLSTWFWLSKHLFPMPTKPHWIELKFNKPIHHFWSDCHSLQIHSHQF